jgi:ribosomal protein S18 acetylase RimI-like enzyme
VAPATTDTRIVACMPNHRLRRLATAGDLAAVHAIYMQPDVVPYLGIDPAPLAEFAAEFAALLATGAFFVVEQEAVVRGFYRATRYKGRARHVATLQTLAVDPRQKGSGLAPAMIREALDCLRAEGVLRVELLVEADNPRGIAFYRKLGFVHEGTMAKAYKRSHEPGYVDELLMVKWLGD